MTPTAGTPHCWDRQPGSFTLTGRWSGAAGGHVVDLDSRVRVRENPAGGRVAGGSTGPLILLVLDRWDISGWSGGLRQCGDPVAGVHDGVCPGPGDGDFEVSPAAGCSPVMSHSSTVPPWSLMPAATVPACPGAAPPAPRPRPGRRGRMQWLRRFRSRHRSPARRCHPGQASPETHSLARNGLRPRNSEGTGLRGQSCLHYAQRPARNNAHAAVRRTPGQAGSATGGRLRLASRRAPRPGGDLQAQASHAAETRQPASGNVDQQHHTERRGDQGERAPSRYVR